MADGAALIEYARDGLETPADRLLRNVVAWAAILYGGLAVVGTALVVALARGWAASPRYMSWGMGDRTTIVLMVARTLTMGGFILGAFYCNDGRGRASPSCGCASHATPC